MKRFAAIVITFASLCMGVAHAQETAPATDSTRGFEIEGGFATVRANASPNACGCFFMYGGNVQAAYAGSHGLAVLAGYGITTASNINSNGNNLTLSTYMAGVRYAPHIQMKKFSTYGQLLVGAAHTGSNYAIDDGVNRFAFAAGGGLNLELSSRVDLRLVEADYLLTRIPNAVNEIQNQLRISSGLVFHFRARH